MLWHYCHYLHVSFSCRLTAGAGSGSLHVGRGSVSAVFIQFPRGVSPPEHAGTKCTAHMPGTAVQSHTSLQIGEQLLGVVICLMLLVPVAGDQD